MSAERLAVEDLVRCSPCRKWHPVSPAESHHRLIFRWDWWLMVWLASHFANAWDSLCSFFMIPPWLSSFSSEVSMLAGTGHFAQASSPEK